MDMTSTVLFHTTYATCLIPRVSLQFQKNVHTCDIIDQCPSATSQQSCNRIPNTQGQQVCICGCARTMNPHMIQVITRRMIPASTKHYTIQCHLQRARSYAPCATLTSQIERLGLVTTLHIVRNQ